MTIQPDDLRAHLGTTAAPAATDAQLYDVIAASYFYLRRCLAGVALALPVVLWLGAGYDQPQRSLSAYYHYVAAGHAGAGSGTMRDVFVGALWAIGTSLVFYRGYSRREDLALNLAGAAAVTVSLFPMDWPPDAATTWVGRVHAGGGIVFFLAVAYVCIFRAGDTLDRLPDPAVRRWFKRIYAGIGATMVASPLAVLLIDVLSDAGRTSLAVLVIEVIGMYVFAAYWLVKGREIALLPREA